MEVEEDHFPSHTWVRNVTSVLLQKDDVHFPPLIKESNIRLFASVKKPAIIETIRLNRLRWFGHVQRMEENRIPKRVL